MKSQILKVAQDLEEGTIDIKSSLPSEEQVLQTIFDCVSRNRNRRLQTEFY